MNLKKNFSQKNFDRLPEERFVRPLVHPQNVSIMMYEHNTTPLLKPDSDLILNFDNVFAFRSFRLPHGFQAINLPQFDDDEIWTLLAILEEEYKKNPDDHEDNHEPNEQPSKKLSKFEKNLLLAKDYLLKDHMNFKQISYFTGLKETQVKSLSHRLQTSGQIFPFQNKRPCKLKQQHINFLISLITQKNGCILTLTQLKNQNNC